MLIDNKTILTGRFNFTNQAERENAENLLVLRNHPDIAAMYRKNFDAHKAHCHNPGELPKPHLHTRSSGTAHRKAAESFSSIMHRMRDEWIAVARGLKCLTISIRVTAATLLAGLFAFLLELGGLILFSLSCWEVFLLPGGIGLIVGLIFSTAGRFHMLRVPAVVPNGRYLSLASLTFEMIAFASLGGYLALDYLSIELPRSYRIAWMGGTAILAVAGMIGFIRLINGLIGHIGFTETVAKWRDIRKLWIAILVLIGVAVALSRTMAWPCVLFSVLLIFIALALVGSSFSRYQPVLKSLRFSALREAVRCGNRSDNRDD